jgi:protein AroM
VAECGKAWLIEPDRVIPPRAAELMERRRVVVIVPLASQIAFGEGQVAIVRPPAGLRGGQPL